MVKINIAWNGIRTVLENNFSFNAIKEIIGLAGFDLTSLSHIVQRSGGGASKGQLMTGVDKGLGLLSDDEKQHFLNLVVEEIANRNSDLLQDLERYLSRLGWQIIDGLVIPIDILDISDIPNLPDQARDDLIKASTRIRDGDLSGAVSSACSAVDSVTSSIYQKHGLGDACKASFQERCKVVIRATGILDEICDQLSDLGWNEDQLTPFSKNLEGALNQAAYVLQTLRASMSDVHGTKPVLRPLVFDSIKWAQILVRVMTKQ